MAWSASAIFQQAMLNPIAGRCWTTAAPTTYSSLSADTIKCALYSSNTITPDKAATLANTAYNAGQWVSGGESSATGYTAAGTALGSKAFAIDTGSSSICFTAANPSWTITAGTLTAYGDLIYDDTITVTADQGLCYNYFGGQQTLTGGTGATFTVQWATPPSALVTAVFNITV